MEKRNAAGRRLRTFIIIVCALALLAGLVPAAILQVFLNRHCDYRGLETEKYAMQGIYTAEEFELSETVRFLHTEDGETVWVSEVAPAQPKAAVICLSGIMQPSVTYFYGHAKLFSQAQTATFLLEVRAHGQSSGSRLGLGFTEVADVRAVVDHIKTDEKYRDVPIILLGVSMGGSIALNAFGQLADVDGCIAMSPYASFETELELLMAQYHVPRFLRVYELVFLRHVLRQNFGAAALETCNPQDQIQNAGDRPVALIACSEDRSVPVENTRILAARAPSASVWIRDSWEHFIVRNCDFRNVAQDSEYCDFVLQFIEAVRNAA